jgi:4-alpha-glucanotransferase
MTAGTPGGREAGLLLPLFSLRSRRDWGIGEIGDMPAFAAWTASAGHRLWQLLPILEMSLGERSPYAALSAFAIDPIYLSMADVEDFVAAGGEEALPPADREALARTRSTRGIDYDAVRRLKRAGLELGFARFETHEQATGSLRAQAFARFREEEQGWLDDYALFRALQETHAGRAWTDWEAPLRDRTPEALAAARTALAGPVRFHAWAQWVVSVQWAAARGAAHSAGVRLKGDWPFMVSKNSADVWPRPDEFDLSSTIGAPPDAFNTDGQDWGLPPYRWEVMARNNYAWLCARAGETAALFDAFRLDHVVGYYRQYLIGADGAGTFQPPPEGAQIGLGERLLTKIIAAGGPTEAIGEDLGVVPPFVRRSLTALGIPGYRVLRWETDGDAFRDPRGYPALSVATTGTHDTSALAVWWEDELGDDRRRALAAVPPFAALGDADARFTPAVHEALLDGLYAAGSRLAVIPFPDAYGGRERINVPATVDDANWSYRLPWTVEELGGGAADDVRRRLAALAERHGR